MDLWIINISVSCFLQYILFRPYFLLLLSTPPTTLKKETLCDDVIRSRMMRREKCVLNVRQQGKPRDFVSKAKLLFEGVRLNT